MTCCCFLPNLVPVLSFSSGAMGDFFSAWLWHSRCCEAIEGGAVREEPREWDAQVMEWGPVLPVYLGRILLRIQWWRPCRRQAVSDTTTWWSTFTHVLSEHQLSLFLLLLCSDLVDPVLWIEIFLSCQYGTRISKWCWIRKNVMNWYLRRNFSSKNLQGQIPAAIGNLTDLTEMYVSLSDFRNKFMLW